jgi:hypothetical protein
MHVRTNLHKCWGSRSGSVRLVLFLPDPDPTLLTIKLCRKIIHNATSITFHLTIDKFFLLIFTTIAFQLFSKSGDSGSRKSTSDLDPDPEPSAVY